MIIEFYLNNFYTDQESKDLFKQIRSTHKVDSVLINQQQQRFAKYFFPSDRINIYIDYPLGLNTSYIRLKNIESIAGQSKIVSIQAPSYLLVNRKYAPIRKEIEQIKAALPDSTEIRYMLDYRKFNHNILHKLCLILKENNINIIYPATGFFLDNIYDHIIASKYLEEKSQISAIFNGNIWTKDHVELIIKSRLYGVSLEHIYSLNLIKDYHLYDTEK
jgi:deoxyribose-phosphate aldolase